MSRSRNRLVADWFSRLRVNAITSEVEQIDVVDSIVATESLMTTTVTNVVAATNNAVGSVLNASNLKTINGASVIGSGDIDTKSGLIQQSVWDGHPGLTDLNSTLAWLAYCNQSFTPERSDTVIVMRYSCKVRNKDNHGIGTFRSYIGGVENTDGRWVRNENANTNTETYQHFPVVRVPSWGAGITKTGCGWKARDYGGSNELYLHSSNYSNGSGTDLTHHAEFVIEEWLI